MAHHHLLPAAKPVSDELWAGGAPGESPRVGDLFVVGYDGIDYGLVLVAAVRDTHVMVWPVTDENVTPSATSFKIEADWLNQTLIGWPEAEAGMSEATLDRKLGTVLQDRTMIGIHDFIRGGDQPADVSFCPERQDDAFFDSLDIVCAYAADLSDHDWPEPEQTVGVLNPDFVADHALTPRRIAALLAVTVPRIAQDLLAARRILTASQVDRLAAEYRAEASAVTIAPQGREAGVLRSVAYKQRIKAIATASLKRENDIRFDAWTKTQLPARQVNADSPEAARARVEQALTELENSLA